MHEQAEDSGNQPNGRYQHRTMSPGEWITGPLLVKLALDAGRRAGYWQDSAAKNFYSQDCSFFVVAISLDRERKKKYNSLKKEQQQQQTDSSNYAENEPQNLNLTL